MDSTAAWLRSQPVRVERFEQTLAHGARRVQAGVDVRVVLRETLDELGLRPTRELRLAAIAEEPVLVDARTDALLAALAEHVALAQDASRPNWCLGERRFLDRMWFVPENRAFWPTALRESPASFRRRGIFLPRSTLERI